MESIVSLLFVDPNGYALNVESDRQIVTLVLRHLPRIGELITLNSGGTFKVLAVEHFCESSLVHTRLSVTLNFWDELIDE